MTDAKEAPVNSLRVWRLKNRVSQFAAAARLALSASILKEWEAGSVTPRPERFERIAALMGTDAEALRRAWERWERQTPIRESKLNSFAVRYAALEDAFRRLAREDGNIYVPN